MTTIGWKREFGETNTSTVKIFQTLGPPLVHLPLLQKSYKPFKNVHIRAKKYLSLYELCILMHLIIRFLTLTLVRTWYDKSHPWV